MNLTVPHLMTITPQISVSRTSGSEPFHVYADGAATSATLCDSGVEFLADYGRDFDAYEDLEYSWEFGCPDQLLVTHPRAGLPDSNNGVYPDTIDANVQSGPEAVFVYRNPGTYTITLTVKGWTGTQWISAAATQDVTVNAYSGSTRYYDSAYDGSAGVSDGTIEKPFTVLDTWVQTTNRRAFLKCGGTYTLAGHLKFNGQNCQVMAYGSGEKPKLRSAAPSGLGLIHVETGNFASGPESLVFDGLDLDNGNAVQREVFVQPSTNGTTPPIKPVKHVLFLGCDFNGLVDTKADVRTGEDIGFINCRYYGGHTQDDSTVFSILAPMDKQLFVMGCLFDGGGSATASGKTFDHHIYPKAKIGHQLFRWNKFQKSDGRFGLSYCINAGTNANDLFDSHWMLIAENDFGDTDHCVDLSNSNNDLSGFGPDQVIIQNNWCHTQKWTVFCYTPVRVTFRNNQCWQPLEYTDPRGGVHNLGYSRAWWLAYDNKMHQREDASVTSFDLDHWHDGGNEINTAGWRDPANGDFYIEPPPPTLEERVEALEHRVDALEQAQ